MELTEIDRKLLAEVQRDNRQSGERLGERVGLSPTACQRRLKRLREAGVIEADVSVVSPAALGRPMTLVVTVELERERIDIVDEFKRAVAGTPEIQSGYYLTGEADFLLVVTAVDMEDFEAFTRRFFYGNPHIRRFKTRVVIDRVKTGLALPLT